MSNFKVIIEAQSEMEARNIQDSLTLSMPGKKTYIEHPVTTLDKIIEKSKRSNGDTVHMNLHGFTVVNCAPEYKQYYDNKEFLVFHPIHDGEFVFGVNALEDALAFCTRGKFEALTRFYTNSEFEIWSEGYQATGGSGTAVLWGSVVANDFKTACEIYAEANPEFKKYFNPDTLTVWGCKLFTNQEEAAKSFG